MLEIGEYKGNKKIINIYFICKILTNLCKWWYYNIVKIDMEKQRQGHGK